MRGFRNVGREPACLMAILGGTDPGRVTWPAEILEKAKKTGLRFDANGNVIQGYESHAPDRQVAQSP